MLGPEVLGEQALRLREALDRSIRVPQSPHGDAERIEDRDPIIDGTRALRLARLEQVQRLLKVNDRALGLRQIECDPALREQPACVQPRIVPGAPDPRFGVASQHQRFFGSTELMTDHEHEVVEDLGSVARVAAGGRDVQGSPQLRVGSAIPPHVEQDFAPKTPHGGSRWAVVQPQRPCHEAIGDRQRTVELIRSAPRLRFDATCTDGVRLCLAQKGW